MNNLPEKLKKELQNDPEYKICLRNALLNDHICKADDATGRFIEWEHTFVFGGRQIQEKWNIIPICWYVHRGQGLNKEINQWIALNRASDADLLKYSKAINYIMLRETLNEKYGGN